jgi:hypothetical protein
MTDPRYPLGRFSPPAEFTPALRNALIGDLAALPGLLRDAVAGLTADQRLVPYREGGWTVAQVVHHLADSHMNAYVRVRLAVTEDTPTIRAYHEGRWADLPDAADPAIDVSLRLVEGLHARLVHLLSRLTAADFERALVHPERGPTTVDRTVALYAWHGRHHIAHITTLRGRMGW